MHSLTPDSVATMIRLTGLMIMTPIEAEKTTTCTGKERYLFAYLFVMYNLSVIIC